MNRPAKALLCLTAVVGLCVPLQSVLGWPSPAGQPAAPTKDKKPPAKPTKPATPVKAGKPAEAASDPYSLKAEEVLATLAEKGDFQRANDDLDALWRAVVAYVPTSQAATYRSVDAARRLVAQVSQFSADAPARRLALYKFLRASPRLARALPMLMLSEQESAGEVYGVLDRLREKHGARVEELANLTAAICVVYDKPLVRRFNENTAKGPDPVDLFGYFSAAEKDMIFGLREVPPELLLYVVDTPATIDELEWALKKYKGDRQIGNHYKEVKYDTNAFKRGTKKKVTAEGFNLPSILKNGGVCIDQAHFASCVGKALGVPTAVVTGAAASVGHAWVGYLKSAGRGVQWDFDTGRYEDYQNVRGNVTDPQTGGQIADGNLAILAESMLLDADTRQAGTALVHAAMTLRDIAALSGEPDQASWPPKSEGITPPAGVKARDTGVGSQLELLEASLKLVPASPRGWEFLTTVAASGQMPLAEKKRWGEVLEKLTGGKYQDFAMQVLEPMISSVTDTAEQDALWESMFESLRSRPDLACGVRVREGAMWEKAGDAEKAWAAYQDAVDRFVNDGPFALDALAASERLLKARGVESAAVDMYKRAFARTKKPGQMAREVTMGSNWYRIGFRYAELLDQNGQAREGDNVRRQIGAM